jgi:hypothetical protein
MILPLTTLIVLFLHAIGYCTAFSGVPCRSLQYGVKRAGPSHRFVKQPTFAQHTVFTTLPLSAATSDNREPLQTNQTVSSNFTTSDTLTAEGNSIGTSETKKGLFARFRGEKFDKASLAKLGGSVLLSYGFVSNVFGITCVSCAWYIASKKTGLSPLAPGQWKGFVAVYAAFFAFLNVIRPARLALSVYISRYFDKALQGIQNRFRCSKPVAVGILVTFNVCFNFAYMFLGISIASALAAVPLWAGRV